MQLFRLEIEDMKYPHCGILGGMRELLEFPREEISEIVDVFDTCLPIPVADISKISSICFFTLKGIEEFSKELVELADVCFNRDKKVSLYFVDSDSVDKDILIYEDDYQVILEINNDEEYSNIVKHLFSFNSKNTIQKGLEVLTMRE